MRDAMTIQPSLVRQIDRPGRRLACSILLSVSSLALAGCGAGEKPATPPVAAVLADPLVRSTLGLHAIVVLSGHRQQLESATFRRRNSCESAGFGAVTFLRKPAHGEISVGFGQSDRPPAPGTSFDACAGKPIPSTLIFYRSEPGFVGHDTARIKVSYPFGFFSTSTYDITVK